LRKELSYVLQYTHFVLNVLTSFEHQPCELLYDGKLGSAL